MPRRIYDFGVPDRVGAGTVGLPGNRTFFLQARKGSALVSVVLEKVKVLDRRVAEKMGFAKVALVTGQTYSRKVDSGVMQALAKAAPAGARTWLADVLKQAEPYRRLK